MIYIVNSFSLNMIDPKEFPCSVHIDPVKSSCQFFSDDADDGACISKIGRFDVYDLTSAIGHQSTVNILNDMLGACFPMNRISLSLKKGETIIVAQYTGPRLDEGVTELPEGAEIKFYSVTITSPGEL